MAGRRFYRVSRGDPVGLGIVFGGRPKGMPVRSRLELTADFPHEPIPPFSGRTSLPWPLRCVERHAAQARIRDDSPRAGGFVFAPRLVADI
jgi:hypothetical protein